MAEIRFSPEAINDLEQTKTYITEELGSAPAAIHTVTEIMKRIRMLSVFPEAGTPLSSIVSYDLPYRFLVCDKYLAFYRYEQDTVYIVRILYGKRDYLRILLNKPDDEEN